MKGVGHAPRGPRSVSVDASDHKEHEYIWLMGGNLNGFCDIRPFMKWWGRVMLSQGPFETHLQNFISRSIIPKISRQSVQWLLRTHPDKIWADFGVAFESAILMFKPFVTALHISIIISIISPNFIQILQVVTENLCGQNLGRKKKKQK